MIIRFKCLSMVGLLCVLLIGCATTSKHVNLLDVRKGNLNYDGGKIALTNIEGWPEAVNIMKGSFINSLFDLYTADPDEASYQIVGNIYAKRYWKSGRLYFFYTVNLQLINKSDTLVMTFKNTEPFYQPKLSDFTDQVVKSIKGI
jgi:hypothetical protein